RAGGDERRGTRPAVPPARPPGRAGAARGTRRVRARRRAGLILRRHERKGRPWAPFPHPGDGAYFTPCISRCISGAIRNRRTPGSTSAQKPKVWPASAGSTLMPSLLLTWLAKMPDRLSPMAVDRKQPPIAEPTSLVGAGLVVIDSPIGGRHSSPTDWIP